MTSRSHTRTVFLVDDNPQFRTSAQWWLSGAGYEVRDFGDSESAFNALCEAAETEPGALRHACLLLDVRMPGMSGLDLHDRLADSGITLRPQDTQALAAAPHPTLPVVYMTGHGDVPLAVSAMQKGAVTMLEKPFAEQALETALERAFTAAESAWARAQMAQATQPRDGDSALCGMPGMSGMPGLQHRTDAAWQDTTPGAFADSGAPAPDAEGRLEFQRRLETLSPRQLEVYRGIVAGKLTKQIAWDCGLSAKTVEFHRKAVMSKLQARTVIELLRMAISGCVEPAAA
jgi:two-component system, LuxR family, response regulator FixJ